MSRLSREPVSAASTATSSYKNTLVICEALVARGINAEEVLRAAGIEPAEYEGTDKRVPFEAEDRLFRLLVERTGDPSIGIDVVDYLNPTVYEALGVALLCSSTLRNFFLRFQRFFEIVGRTPPQFSLDFAGVNGIASIVPRPISYKTYEPSTSFVGRSV